MKSNDFVSHYVPALNLPHKESALHTVQYGRLRRGGRRNNAGRKSNFVSLRQAEGVMDAADRAIAVWRPFNRFITINFKALGIPDRLGAKAAGKFVKLASDWLGKRGKRADGGNDAVRLPWTWVRENFGKGGPHVHMLLHVPPELASDYNRRQPCWINIITKKFSFPAEYGNDPPRRRGAVKTRSIGRSSRAYKSDPASYEANLLDVISYILKGAKNEVIQKLQLHRGHSEEGEIIGKRAAWWQA